MSDKDLHRHDLTEEQWKILEPILPGQGGNGRSCKRQSVIYERGFMDFEDGSTLARLAKRIWEMRQRRWQDAGVWERILSVLAEHPDFEWLMIEASHCKVHPHAAGAIGGNEGRSRTKGAMKNLFGHGCVWYAGSSHCY